jgi:hypothetical protein
MSETDTSNAKIVIGFSPIVVHPIPGVHPPNTPSRAGGYNTWVEVSHDFTLDRIGEIFDIVLPWADYQSKPNSEASNAHTRKSIEVPSSDGKRKYLVQREPNGMTLCSCPGFGFHGYCKHQGYIDNPDSIPAPKKGIKINVPPDREHKPVQTKPTKVRIIL